MDADPDLRRAIYRLRSNPFVKPDDAIEYGYTLLQNLGNWFLDTRRFLANTYGVDYIAPLRKYIYCNFLGYARADGSWREPRYAVEMWSSWEVSTLLLPRSNNMAEGFHSGFKTAVGSHPKVGWNFFGISRA